MFPDWPCLNVVARPGEAVLLRAIRPEVWIDVMRERRGGAALLAAGPVRVRLSDNGNRFGSDAFVLEEGIAKADLLTGPRIGITRAAERPWRFGMAGTGGAEPPVPVWLAAESQAREKPVLVAVAPPVDAPCHSCRCGDER